MVYKMPFSAEMASFAGSHEFSLSHAAVSAPHNFFKSCNKAHHIVIASSFSNKCRLPERNVLNRSRQWFTKCRSLPKWLLLQEAMNLAFLTPPFQLKSVR